MSSFLTTLAVSAGIGLVAFGAVSANQNQLINQPFLPTQPNILPAAHNPLVFSEAASLPSSLPITPIIPPIFNSSLPVQTPTSTPTPISAPTHQAISLTTSGNNSNSSSTQVSVHSIQQIDQTRTVTQETSVSIQTSGQTTSEIPTPTPLAIPTPLPLPTFPATPTTPTTNTASNSWVTVWNEQRTQIVRQYHSSDQNGNFHLNNLPGGIYYVLPQTINGGQTTQVWSQPMMLTVPNGNSSSTINFNLGN